MDMDSHALRRVSVCMYIPHSRHRSPVCPLELACPLPLVVSGASGYQGCGLGLNVSVSRRSRDLPKVSSRSRLDQLGQRLGLVSVSRLNVSVSVSAIRVSCTSHNFCYN